jgi:hypothetical protein
MAGIKKGTEAAMVTYGLFETWTRWKEGRLEESEVDAAFQNTPFTSEVVYNLIVIVSNALGTVANLEGRSFEDARADLWLQLAAGTDDHAARVMREAVTAWTSGSVEDAQYVNESGMLTEVDPSDLMMHFVALWTMLAGVLTEHAGKSLGDALEVLRLYMGIPQ